MSQHRRQFLLTSLQIFDLMIMVGAFAFAVHLAQLDPHVAEGVPEISKLIFVAGLPIIWHWTFSSFRLYRSRRLSSGLREAFDVLKASSLSTLMILSLGLLLQVTPLNAEAEQLRAFMLAFWILATGSTITVRLALRMLLEWVRSQGRNLRHVLVAGTNSRALEFAQRLQARPELGYWVVGFVDEAWDGLETFSRSGFRVVANFKSLSAYLRENVVDEMVIALPFSSSYKQSARIVRLCEKHGITVHFVSQIFDVQMAKAKVEVFHDEPVFTLHTGTMDGPPMVAKRMIDLLGSLTLLVLLAPLLALVALAIKLTSPGPVFFVQERVGLNKRRFKLYKFRTMVVDAEARLAEIAHLNEVSGPVFKIEKDPRITRIGAFLRKTSIDELPQLINVLLGDMSLVGPRPLPLRDYEGFDHDWHRRRFSVRPGITCFWQIEGRSSIPFEKWMELDMKYIDNWSLWLDFKILLKTVPALFSSPGDTVEKRSVPATRPSMPSLSGNEQC